MKRILFLAWEGPQTNYLESLFLPIFAGLRDHGFGFAVLHFTWGDLPHSQSVAQACERAGISYRRVAVWRAGALGALASAIVAGRQVDRAIRDWAVDAVMPRSLMPALALLASRRGRVLPIIYDSDGLAADERAEFGGLSHSDPRYRILRLIERTAVRVARVVLVRTNETIAVLCERASLAPSDRRFRTVTNGRDPTPFLAAVPISSPPAQPRLCYLGSTGPQYEPDRALNLARELHDRIPGLRLSIFTGDTQSMAVMLQRAGLENAEWVALSRLAADEVAPQLARHDIGLALRKQSLSMSAVSPIKIAEFMLAGMPIIGSPSVGPAVTLAEAGCLLSDQTPPDVLAGWVRAVMDDREAWRERCRSIALELFSLERSVGDYAAALAPLRD